MFNSVLSVPHEKIYIKHNVIVLKDTDSARKDTDSAKDTNSAHTFPPIKDTYNGLMKCPFFGSSYLMSKHPVPTGDPWKLSETHPATVPVPLPVIIVKVEGPYTERDRKLWTFLLHAVWDELGEKRIHELSAHKINQVFRMLGGDHNTNWIWESAKRLVDTKVIFECEEEDERYQGIASLLSAAAVGKRARETGFLRFEFPSMLIPILKEPGRFARLRVHFLIGLSGKYAVSLYEILESIVNKIDPVMEVSLDALRQWLKVPEGKLTRWVHLNQRVIQPAIEQINTNPLGAGFTVDVHPIKKGRSVDRIRFTVCKVDERRALEDALQGKSSMPDEGGRKKEALPPPPVSLGPLFEVIRLSGDDYERAREAAPGWDIYELERQWREWIIDKESPQRPGPAFVAFCRQKYRKNGRP